MRSDVFPVGLKLDGKLCLVVGTGHEAERRTEALLAAGARVRVVSERPTESLERRGASGEVALLRRGFEDGDLDGAWLAVYTDMEVDVATRIGGAADARRIFFCGVDRPAQSSYSHAAIVKAGPVTVAISTDGRAPLLARKLKDVFTRVFDDAGLADFAAELSTLRERTPPAERRSVLEAATRSVRFDGRLVLRNDEAGQGEWPKKS